MKPYEPKSAYYKLDTAGHAPNVHGMIPVNRKASAYSRSNQVQQSPMQSNGSKFHRKKSSLQDAGSIINAIDEDPYGRKRANDGIKLPKLRDNNATMDIEGSAPLNGRIKPKSVLSTSNSQRASYPSAKQRESKM